MGTDTRKRAVITGIGVVSPAGLGAADFWTSLRDSRPGLGPITRFPTDHFPTHLAAEVKNWEQLRTRFLTDEEIRFFALNTQFAIVAAKLAVSDAAIVSLDLDRTDVVMGCGAEPHGELYEQILRAPQFLSEFGSSLDPLIALKMMAFAPAAAISLQLGVRGQCLTVSSACNSAFSSLGVAFEKIQLGGANTVICGGAESPINWLMMSALAAANMLTLSEDASDALHPFDIRRDKSAMGEGAGVFVMEELEHALSRGATIYGEMLGHMQSQENRSIFFSTDKSGRRWSEIIQQAIHGEHVDCINAHAPSDAVIDLVESKALRLAFGEEVQSIPVVSFKASFGSGLASAGAFQTAASLLMLRHQELLPTTGFARRDPAIPLDVTTSAKRTRIRTVLQNAKALGGSEASVLFGRYVA